MNNDLTTGMTIGLSYPTYTYPITCPTCHRCPTCGQVGYRYGIPFTTTSASAGSEYIPLLATTSNNWVSVSGSVGCQCH